jgi:hypothetical protein
MTNILLTELMLNTFPLAVSWHDRFGHSLLENVLLLVLFVLVITGGVWLAIILKRGWPGNWAPHHPHNLFVTLCHAHKLDRNQQRLLLLLAQWHRLPQPSAIFVEPELFDASRLGQQFAPHLSQVQSLRQRLFGTDFPPANLS